MISATLPETASQRNTPEKARLFALLNNLPAEERAEVYLGIVVKLADRLDSAPRVNR
jgi:hypothetical protein